MNHPLLGKEGERHLLLGNEAIVRGALEAGIGMVACYPGTPSSEIPDTFYRLRECGRYVMEFSTNEKVAFEVAAGAAHGGALALTAMKHVGLNVAADPLLTSTYVGVPGGLLVVSADDPGCHSSQNEQDNRRYARFAQMPCFEPASAQEAKEMAKEALLLSRESEQPVLLRTTTRVNHLRGRVDFGPLPDGPLPVKPYKKEPTRFVPVPGVAKVRHRALAKAMDSFREMSEKSGWNTVRGNGKAGVIASGISRCYLNDAIAQGGYENELTVFELGFSFPLPEKKLCDFMRKVDKLLVIEELEPILETELRALAQQHGIQVEIIGKGGPLTIFGEYDTPKVSEALASLLGKPFQPVPVNKPEELPQRPPNLCAGCAHRAFYYAVRKTFGDDAIYASDIGCYTLGMAPPLRTADYLFCMGASVSSGSGTSRVRKDLPVVSFVGDSTFFHTGINGLINAVFNKHNQIIVILDNGTTAMTGHQPNPGMDQDVLGSTANHLDIESIVRALGVTRFAKVKPYNLKASLRVLEEMKEGEGVRVILAEEPCVLYARRTLKKARPQVAYVAEQGASATACAQEFACPAFSRDGDTVSVDDSLCAGCMLCMQISDSFKARKKEAVNG
ncbi:indolepyruvate ferredoxin oxidoreductase subunit alpha [Desulfovibrio sp. OttesenSCG-928-C06]|nr:indolepyruvate ferredoxin oxidoreductase subunit alpha [Desulfovibrio sp. OttesenSCG-928-C06]